MDGALEAVARPWAVGPDAQGRHQAHDRRHEDDDPLAHGLFNASPIGDGYEVEVNEFDFRDDNGVCYDKDGVTIRHWRRSHTKDGASAYRLDWNGLSFVWTGDGRPDELSLELAKGVDVFVTEVQPDTANLQALKFGMPPIIVNTTIDQAHSPHYAIGYMFNKIQPRLAMVTHLSYDEELIPEIIAGIRVHYSGLFQFGAPDVVVVNVTKDAVWTRKAAIPEAGNMARPSPRDAIGLFDLSPTNLEVEIPESPAYGRRHAGAGRPRSRDRPEEVLPVRHVSRAAAQFPERLQDRCSPNRPKEAPRGCRPNSRPSRRNSSNSSTSSRADEADGSQHHGVPGDSERASG